jgi:hypothetical protein
MSYGSTVSGAILISPPLTTAELRSHPEFLKNDYNRDQETYIAVIEEIVHQKEDDLIRRTGNHIELRTRRREIPRYHLEENIQAIVDAYPDRTFTGYFELAGEDGDLRRLAVWNRRVTEIRPVITWPDDEHSRALALKEQQ